MPAMASFQSLTGRLLKHLAGKPPPTNSFSSERHSSFYEDEVQACPTSLNSKSGMPVAFSSASNARLRSTPPA